MLEAEAATTVAEARARDKLRCGALEGAVQSLQGEVAAATERVTLFERRHRSLEADKARLIAWQEAAQAREAHATAAMEGARQQAADLAAQLARARATSDAAEAARDRAEAQVTCVYIYVYAQAQVAQLQAAANPTPNPTPTPNPNPHQVAQLQAAAERAAAAAATAQRGRAVAEAQSEAAREGWGRAATLLRAGAAPMWG